MTREREIGELSVPKIRVRASSAGSGIIERDSFSLEMLISTFQALLKLDGLLLSVVLCLLSES